jgi:hypothetical protein
MAAFTGAQAAPLTLVIQPSQGETMTVRAHQALADYLSRASGERIVVVTPPNFLAHWETIRRNSNVDLVLDDAHFTDYRVDRLGFHVLAKLPGTVSYSLVAAEGIRARDPLLLTGKKVASFGPPSIGAARLNAMFPNPSRRPSIIDITAVEQGLDLLKQRKVDAAMLPTSAIGDAVDRGRLSVLTTTEPAPRMALSASPKLDSHVREKIRNALLRATESADGKHMLGEMQFSRFEAATAAMYAGQSRLLRDVWGYR